jgi:predicted MFS family arabinose efflux permease
MGRDGGFVLPLVRTGGKIGGEGVRMDSRVFWLAVAAFVGAIEGGMIAGLLPLISADFGVTPGQAGLVVLGYSLAYAVGPPLLAVLLGGVGRRRILAGAEFGLAVCALMMAVMPFFEGVVAIRTILAVAAGTFTGTAMATAAMIAPFGQRGRYMQVISLGQAIAALAGVPLGAFVADKFGWRVDYYALALMAGLAALALYKMLPRGMPGDSQTMRDRIRVLRNPGVDRALLSTLLFMMGSAPIMVYVGALMAALGLDYQLLPLVLLSGGIGAVACGTMAGRMADRFGSVRTGLMAGIAVLAVMGLYVVLPMLPQALALPGMLLVAALQGLVGRAYNIAVTSHMAHLAPTAVPVAISLNMSTFSIGMAVAAAVGGIVVDGWGALTLPLVGAPLIALAMLVWRTVPEAELHRTPPPAG